MLRCWYCEELWHYYSWFNEFQQTTDREVGTLSIEENSDQAQAKNKIGPNTELDVIIRDLNYRQRNVLIQVRDIHRILLVNY